MKRYVYIVLALVIMLIGCKKEEILVDNQIKVGLVKLEVEVKSGTTFYRDEIEENHLDSFILTGVYSDNTRKNIVIKSEYITEFKTMNLGETSVKFLVDKIEVEAKINIVENPKYILRKLEVEVKNEIKINQWDRKDSHVNSFVLVGVYEDGSKKNIEVIKDYIKVFDTSLVGTTLIKFEINGIGVEVGVEVLEPSGKLIFKDDFDTQADWHSGLEINSNDPYTNDGFNPKVDTIQLARLGAVIPEGWSAVRQGEAVFSPRDSRYPNSHEIIEILGKNSDKAMGKSGKSAVFWRDSYQDDRHMWNTDGILLKGFDEGYDEIYVEFCITFDKNTTTNSHEITNTTIPDMSKLFRVKSWGGEGSEFLNYKGNNGPMLMWTWRVDEYGIRNVIGLRGGPHGENYYMDKEDLGDMPKGYDGYPITNGSFEFVHSIKNQGPNGETEWPLDRINGGLLKDNIINYPTHHQIYGNEGDWTKVAFYLKMNTDFDKNDGVLIQWINGRRVFNNHSIRWYKENSKNVKPKWNSVGIGGNDYFHSYAREDEREEWYAIDNIKIYDGIPSHAEEDINFELTNNK